MERVVDEFTETVRVISSEGVSATALGKPSFWKVVVMMDAAEELRALLIKAALIVPNVVTV